MIQWLSKKIKKRLDKRRHNMPTDEARELAKLKRALLASEKEDLRRLKVAKDITYVQTAIDKLKNPKMTDSEMIMSLIGAAIQLKGNNPISAQSNPIGKILGVDNAAENVEATAAPTPQQDKLDEAFLAVEEATPEQIQGKIAEKTGRKVPLRMVENLKRYL